MHVRWRALLKTFAGILAILAILVLLYVGIEKALSALEFLEEFRGPVLALCGTLLVSWLIKYLILDSLVKIPAYHFAVIESYFSRRNGKVLKNKNNLKDGLQWKLPFFDSVELFSQEKQEIAGTAKFTTKDGLYVEEEWLINYRPDAEVEESGRSVFARLDEKVICSSIEKAVNAKIEQFGGERSYSDFIEHLRELATIISCQLRMSKGKQPHLNHDAQTCEICTKENLQFGSKIDAHELISFYETHWRQINIDDEAQDKKDRSATEIDYGIDIEKFVLRQPQFSVETKKALELKEQAEQKLKAEKEWLKVTKQKVKMAKIVQDELGADAQLSLNTVDREGKNVISIEGIGSALAQAVSAMKKPEAN